MNMEIPFSKLRCKDVINMCDGRNLGNITDIIIDTCCGRILGIAVPNSKNFFNLFKTNNDIFIPINRICKIGKDIILVDIIMQQNCECELNSNPYICNTQNNKNNKNIEKILNNLNNKK